MRYDQEWPRLDGSLPTPLYHQAYLILREKIRRGELAADEALPGEFELADLLGVSRITITRAVNDLAAEKIVVRQRGRGTVVAASVQAPLVRGSYDGLVESIERMGLSTRTDLLETGRAKASRDTAERLDIAVGAPIVRSVSRRLIEGEPFSLVVSHVPEDVSKRFSKKELKTFTLTVLLQRQGMLRLTAEQWISAVVAEPQAAPLLGVAIGSPLLQVERVLSDEAGRPIQHIYCHYHSAKFQWHIASEGPDIGGVVQKRPLED